MRRFQEEAAGDEAGGGLEVEGPVDDLFSSFDVTSLESWKQKGSELVFDFGPLLIGAAITLLLGWIVARILRGVTKRICRASKLDETLATFLSSLVYMLVMAFVLMAALDRLGVNTTSFAAILGAATFAIGFALQGSLGNFAAGVMMMIFRPLKVGDLVEAGGVLGTVREIGIFASVIDTLDNKKVIVANSSITGDNIVNYSANGMLRVDMVFGIGYGDDVDKAQETLMGILKADERVLADPAPCVELLELGDSSVNFAVRPFVHPDHYWDVWFDTHRTVKKTFDEQGISIPFPQRDVHLFQSA